MSGRARAVPRLLIWIAASLPVAAACDRHAPTTPEPAAAFSSAGEDGRARASAAGASEGNQPPAAVFRTRPPADAEGVISGGTSFEVTFNLCQSRDGDPGDELRFSFDFDGDGTVDSLGHCRATRRYEVGAYETGCLSAVACVSDRQPDHKVCRTYRVCAIGRAREGVPGPGPTPSPDPTPTPEPSPTPEPVFTQQEIAGDFTPVASRDAWAFTAEPGTEVSFVVDTVSSETAYAMMACVATGPTWRDCLKPAEKDKPPCAYPPPGGLGCPRKTTVVSGPGRRTYYLVIGGFRFTRAEGLYTVFVRASPGISRLVLALDNGEQPATVED